MHNNHFFFRHLVPVLQLKLENAVLVDCYSQNKDELLIGFKLSDTKDFFIKAHLKSQFSCLSFPKKYNRAKNNSVNLFGSIKGRTIKNITLYKNERAFILEFNNQQQLIFKLFGNQSNIILIDENQEVQLFKNKIARDKSIDINTLNRTLEISFEALRKNDWDIKKTIPILDKNSSKSLANLLEANDYTKESYNHFIKELTDPTFYLEKSTAGYRLSLLKGEFTEKTYTNPIEAINAFFSKQVAYKSTSQLKTTLTANLNRQLIKSNNYVQKLTKKLAELSTGSSNQQKADILMANLHAIAKGIKTVELYNFYNDTPIIIKLNGLLSPQKNAERYYRKAKNEAKEISILKRNIREKEIFIKELLSKIAKVDAETDSKSLQKMQPKHLASMPEIILPYKEYTIDGFKVLVGKNAKHNDTLTLKIAKKNDLWLHAKDVSGSHVVIKQIPGRNYPTMVIEKAAQLAAYHSKRKTDSLCPVLFTQKKYVRKKKGTPAGAMFVEKEQVVLVKPSNQY